MDILEGYIYFEKKKYFIKKITGEITQRVIREFKYHSSVFDAAAMRKTSHLFWRVPIDRQGPCGQ